MVSKAKENQVYMGIAELIATQSNAKRKKVGCIIVSKIGKHTQIISQGFNGTPSGFDNICEDDNGLTKPEVIHAESNCITKLARSTMSCDKATLYVTLTPCVECAKLIIQSGISIVYFRESYKNSIGIDLLEKSRIQVFQI